MKQKRHDHIDLLLRLAWLEGWVNTHGAYEKAVAKREPGTGVNEAARSRLIGKLESALAAVKPEPPLTVGAMLRDTRVTRMLRPQEIFSRIGVTQNIYRMMEQDAISPLKIPVEVWKRLVTLLDLSLGELEGMLRRTHQLVLFRPALRGVLARYKPAGRKGLKAATLETAFKEMYAKAELDIPESDRHRLEKLVTALRKQ